MGFSDDGPLDGLETPDADLALIAIVVDEQQRVRTSRPAIITISAAAFEFDLNFAFHFSRLSAALAVVTQLELKSARNGTEYLTLLTPMGSLNVTIYSLQIFTCFLQYRSRNHSRHRAQPCKNSPLQP